MKISQAMSLYSSRHLLINHYAWVSCIYVMKLQHILKSLIFFFFFSPAIFGQASLDSCFKQQWQNFGAANHYFVLCFTMTNSTAKVRTTYHWFPLYKRKQWLKKLIFSWQTVLLKGLQFFIKEKGVPAIWDIGGYILKFAHRPKLELCKILFLKVIFRKSSISGIPVWLQGSHVQGIKLWEPRAGHNKSQEWLNCP